MSESFQERLSMAMELDKLGRIEDAIKIYEDLLKLDPDNVDALNNMGVGYCKLGAVQEGLKLLQRVVELNPNSPAFHTNIATVYSSQQLYKQAKDHFNKAIALEPKAIMAIQGLAEVQRILGDKVGWLNSSGNAAFRRGNYNEAIELYEKTIAENAALNIAVHLNMARAYKNIGEYKKSKAICEKVLSINPDNFNALTLLSTLCSFAGEWYETQQVCEKILTIDPHHIDTLFIMAEVKLRFGNFEQGWRDYELRFDSSSAGEKCRKFNEPQWEGGPLNGRCLLVHKEQGRGDNIQFIRYVKLIDKSGGKIIVETLPDLVRLFRCVPEIDEIIEVSNTFPPHDVQISIMSFPLVFNTRLDTVPAKVPYFDLPGNKKYDIKKLGGHKKLRVGVAWQGSRTNARDRHRSLTVDQLSQIFKNKHIQFYSFQFLLDENLRSRLYKDYGLIDVSSHCRDYYDSAQYAKQMDLIISVDTAMVHLAGSLNVPVWDLLSRSHCWRYLLEREDNPWYPTLRLFRQRTLDEWDEVLQAVIVALEKWAHRH